MKPQTITFMKSILEQIAVIKSEISSLPHTVRSVYTNGTALRNIWLEKRAELLGELSRHPSPDPMDIPNGTSHPYGFVRSPVFTEVAMLRLVLDISEASPEFQEACNLIEPQLAKITVLEAEHAAAVDLKGRKLAALRDAETAALEAARAAALESPAVVKARRDLEALDQPAPAKTKRQPADSIGEAS